MILWIGEADGPLLRLAGVHLEEPGALIAALLAILDAADRERFVCSAHEVGSRPLAAAVVIEGVNVDEAAGDRSLQQRLAGLRGDVPPAFRSPTVLVAIAD